MAMPSILAISSSIVGFYYYKKLIGTYWITFPFYLFFQGVLDNYGSNFKGSYNILYYSFVIYPYIYFYYIWIFRQNSQNTTFKNIYNLPLILFFINYIVLTIYFKSDIIEAINLGNSSNTNSNLTNFNIYCINNILALLFIIIITYFYELISTSKILNFYQDLQFWVCLGLILFELFTFPYNTFKFYLFDHYPRLGTFMFYIEKLLSALMYLSFITGFICMKKR